jgi:hypothetical protein
MKKPVITALAAILSLAVLPIEASAQVDIRVGPDRPRERTIVKEREPEMRVRTRRVVEEDEDCRWEMRTTRVKSGNVTKVTRKRAWVCD